MAIDEKLRIAIRNEIKNVLAEKTDKKTVAKYINPIYDAIEDARRRLPDKDIMKDLDKVEDILNGIARRYN